MYACLIILATSARQQFGWLSWLLNNLVSLYRNDDVCEGEACGAETKEMAKKIHLIYGLWDNQKMPADYAGMALPC